MNDLQARLAEVRAKAPAVKHVPPPQERAERRAVDGIHRSAAKTGDQWQTDALHTVKQYLLTHPTMFVDDLWDLLPELPEGQESGRGLGRVIQSAAKYGWCSILPSDNPNAAPGDLTSRRSVSSNGAPKWVWRSELYKPPKIITIPPNMPPEEVEELRDYYSDYHSEGN